MNLPSYKRIYKTDYSEDQQDMIEKLAGSLNIGIETLYQALNKRISQRDNFLCTVKDVDVIVDSSGNLKLPVSISLDFVGKADTLYVGKADNLDDPTIYPTSSVWVSWSYTGTNVKINNIKGLQANTNYRLRIVVYGQ